MELWNTRKLKPPPTYTYQAKIGEVDINHLASTLQDGINFYKGQYLLNFETALLARIVYRMKRKFRNSKDFQTLEKVKKDLMIFLQIDIYKKLDFLFSILPTNVNYGKIFLPTKNMMDFILVRLQGVGKIMCRIIEMCKLTTKYYECRLHLGHFWRLAIVAIGLVSRIYILSLNIIKFTCLLYLRLLPFSHKLKNSGPQWLPEDYTFPKDLKEWLNVEWSKFDEVIEIPDKEFDISLIDLVDDSDDDVEFCKEYIELDEDEDVEIIEEFQRINKKIKSIDYENSVTILRGFSSENVDTGEIVSDEEVIELNSNEIKSSPAPSNVADQEKHIKESQDASVQEVDIGELISSTEDVNRNSKLLNDEEKCFEAVDICEKTPNEISEKNELESNQTKADIPMETNVLISSSDEELLISASAEEFELSSDDSVEFVDEVAAVKKKPALVTADFISLNTVHNRFHILDNRALPQGISRKLSISRNKWSVIKRIEPSSYKSVKKEDVKIPQILLKIENIKPDPCHKLLPHIDSTSIKTEDNIKIENINSSVIEVIETPEQKINEYRNTSEENRDETKIIERAVKKKRKRNSKNRRKRKLAKKLGPEDTTLDIADLSRETKNSNGLFENPNTLSSQSLLGVSEISESISDNQNHHINRNWTESLEIAEISFCKSIANTSTPAKKRKRRSYKNKIKKDCLQDSTVGITSRMKRKRSKSSNLERIHRKILLVGDTTDKRVNRKNKHSTVLLKKITATKKQKKISK